MKNSAYLFEITSVFAKPVTDAFDSDELILTGPSPWKILIRFNFIGSIDSIAVKPSIPVTDTEKGVLEPIQLKKREHKMNHVFNMFTSC